MIPLLLNDWLVSVFDRYCIKLLLLIVYFSENINLNLAFVLVFSRMFLLVILWLLNEIA